MVFDGRRKRLVVLSGQRGKEALSDILFFDVRSGRITDVCRDYSINGGPDAGFTQRATADFHRHEIFMFCGLMRSREPTEDVVRNAVWVYDVERLMWRRVYQNENVGAEYWQRMEMIEPCPRFAHQVVFDATRRIHYMFGGNPGDTHPANQRLNDFWELRVSQPSVGDVAEKMRWEIRRLRFLEKCRGAALMSGKEEERKDELKKEESERVAAASSSSSRAEADRDLRRKELEDAIRFLRESVMHSGMRSSSSACEARERVGGLAVEGLRDGGRRRGSPARERAAAFESLVTFFPRHLTQPAFTLSDSAILCHVMSIAR